MVLPLALALLVGSTDAPVTEPAPALTPVVATAIETPRPISFQTRVFPRIPISRVALNVGSSLSRPFRPQLSDAWVIIPGMIGTVVAMNTDLASHAAIRKLPDPAVGGKPLSFWASMLGEGWVDVSLFLAIGLIGGRDGQRACIAGLQALAAVGIASRIGKLAFRVERPSYDPDQQHFFSRPEADAMPSGHAMAAFASAAVLSREYPTLSPLFYALALWVGVARVQQNTHWLSDVVVGAALGTLFGWESSTITREFELEVQPWAGSTGAGLNVARRF